MQNVTDFSHVQITLNNEIISENNKLLNRFCKKLVYQCYSIDKDFDDIGELRADDSNDLEEFQMIVALYQITIYIQPKAQQGCSMLTQVHLVQLLLMLLRFENIHCECDTQTRNTYNPTRRNHQNNPLHHRTSNEAASS